jgi:hypothetical protein
MIMMEHGYSHDANICYLFVGLFVCLLVWPVGDLHGGARSQERVLGLRLRLRLRLAGAQVTPPWLVA